MGIGQGSIKEQPQLVRYQGTALTSSCSGNGNWPACDQGTASASVRRGKGMWRGHEKGAGIGHLRVGEQKSVISGSENRNWIYKDVVREQNRLN